MSSWAPSNQRLKTGIQARVGASGPKDGAVGLVELIRRGVALGAEGALDPLDELADGLLEADRFGLVGVGLIGECLQGPTGIEGLGQHLRVRRVRAKALQAPADRDQFPLQPLVLRGPGAAGPTPARRRARLPAPLLGGQLGAGGGRQRAGVAGRRAACSSRRGQSLRCQSCHWLTALRDCSRRASSVCAAAISCSKRLEGRRVHAGRAQRLVALGLDPRPVPRLGVGDARPAPGRGPRGPPALGLQCAAILRERDPRGP